jgi:hypothetical protein
MKWVLSHATDDIHHWQLQKENGSKSLIFHQQRLSLRLSGLSKRLFFLNVQGFLKKKILLRTEYGIVIGEAPFAEKSLTGQLILNGQTFFYRLEKAQLFLLDSEKQLMARCDLLPEATVEKVEFYSLLFGFAWFLTADAVTEKKPEISVPA